MKATGQTRDQIRARTQVLVTTLGEQGSVLVQDGAEIRVPAARVAKPLDPTGAGDAYRAGLIRGLAPDHPPAVRRGLLRFLVNVLEDEVFDWEHVNRYME
jgi:adenosine kinase